VKLIGLIPSYTLQIGRNENKGRWWNGFHHVPLHSTYF